MTGSAAGLLRLVAALSLAGCRPAGAECDTCRQDDEGALLQVSQRAARSSGEEGTLQEGAADSQKIQATHETLGCFAMAASDSPNDTSVDMYQDKKCIKASQFSADDPCRSGLPFFRRKLEDAESYLDCITFCLSKGLDLSGLALMAGDDVECRCGATPENWQAWRTDTPPAGLLLPSVDQVVQNEDPACKVLVFKYTGGLENGGVPPGLLETSDLDVKYMFQIATSSELVDDEGTK